MLDYQQAKIYKIVNCVNDLLYIGSTCNNLSKRMNWHKSDCKKKSHNGTPFYTAMNEIGIQNFRILLIKKYPCSDRNELHAEEYRVMKEMRDSGVELYNQFIGCVSEATKKRISENHWDNSGEKHPMYGNQHTEESKQKISKSLTGKIHTEATKQKMSENNARFSYGSIYKGEQTINNKSYYQWVYQWRENGKSKSKSFSIKKYGHHDAIQNCINLRKIVYPHYTQKYCEFYYIPEDDEFLIFQPLSIFI